MSLGRFSLIGLLLVTLAVPSRAQDAPGDRASERKDPSSQQRTQFAPGVVTVIPEAPKPEETFDAERVILQNGERST